MTLVSDGERDAGRSVDALAHHQESVAILKSLHDPSDDRHLCLLLRIVAAPIAEEIDLSRFLLQLRPALRWILGRRAFELRALWPSPRRSLRGDSRWRSAASCSVRLLCSRNAFAPMISHGLFNAFYDPRAAGDAKRRLILGTSD